MVTVRKIIVLLFALPVLLLVSCDKSEQDFEKASNIDTVAAYEMFIQKHPDSDLAGLARDRIVSLFCSEDIKEIPMNYKDQKIANRLRDYVEKQVNSKYQEAKKQNTIAGWDAFINYVPYEYLRDAYKRRAALVTEAYQKAERINTIAGWNAYINSVSSIEIRDANERIRELEEEIAWRTESKAWETVLARGTIDAMKKYLEFYPYGAHKKSVENMLIDAEVSEAFNGVHGILPQMDRGSRTGSSYSVIEIENRTQYDLTISYSGPDSRRLVIPPHKTQSVSIGNGNYRIAASVGHGVLPFAGSEKLDGRHFSSSFYISTTRY